MDCSLGITGFQSVGKFPFEEKQLTSLLDTDLFSIFYVRLMWRQVIGKKRRLIGVAGWKVPFRLLK